MSEAQLQQQFVLSFSQNFPHLHGRLIGTFQTSNSKRDTMVKRGLGLVPGVSDLIYFPKPDSGRLTMGLEVKVPGSYHDKDHVLRQCDWMDVCNPEEGYFCLTLIGFNSIIVSRGDFVGNYTPDQMRSLVAESKGKNVRMPMF